eukprot:GHVQ01041136.1.p1 GENE.GHVQ01041136.1~~GHVQ01041136.1.p1  ORF type:complete len:125 (-),score=2.23 GHVQ01041136.1:257-631(-)
MLQIITNIKVIHNCQTGRKINILLKIVGHTKNTMVEKNHSRILVCNENDEIFGPQDGERIPEETLQKIQRGTFVYLVGGRTFGNMVGRKHVGVGYGNTGTGWAFGSTTDIATPEALVDFSDVEF